MVELSSDTKEIDSHPYRERNTPSKSRDTSYPGVVTVLSVLLGDMAGQGGRRGIQY